CGAPAVDADATDRLPHRTEGVEHQPHPGGTIRGRGVPALGAAVAGTVLRPRHANARGAATGAGGMVAGDGRRPGRTSGDGQIRGRATGNVASPGAVGSTGSRRLAPTRPDDSRLERVPPTEARTRVHSQSSATVGGCRRVAEGD